MRHRGILKVGPGGLCGQLFAPFQGLSAQLVAPLDQCYLITGPGRLHGCRKSGNTAAHYQYFFAHFFKKERLGKIGFLGPDAGHPHIVGCQFLNKIITGILCLAPYNLLTNIGPDRDLVIAEVEFILHYPGRTSANHNRIHAFRDITLNKSPPCRATQGRVGLALHTHLAGDNSRKGLNIQGIANTTSCTYICTVFLIH